MPKLHEQWPCSWLCLLSINLIRLYQITLSPYFGRHCRFHPTCSHYAIESLERHGFPKGSYLALHRLLRCHPWSEGGWDPVPRSSDEENEPSNRKP